MTALLVFALPFALYGLAYGSYCLGRSLARLVPILWAKFRQKRKDRPSLQRRCSNNLNQIAVHAHTYGLYPEEIDGLKEDYEKLWGQLSGVLKELAALVGK